MGPSEATIVAGILWPLCQHSMLHPQPIQPAIIIHLFSDYSPQTAGLMLTDGSCDYQRTASLMDNVNMCTGQVNI